MLKGLESWKVWKVGKFGRFGKLESWKVGKFGRIECCWLIRKKISHGGRNFW